MQMYQLLYCIEFLHHFNCTYGKGIRLNSGVADSWLTVNAMLDVCNVLIW